MPRVEIPLSRYGLVTVEGAAELRGVSVRRVQQYIEQGQIPVVVVGAGRNRKHLLPRAEVEAFVPLPPHRPRKGDSPARASRKRKG